MIIIDKQGILYVGLYTLLALQSLRNVNTALYSVALLFFYCIAIIKSSPNVKIKKDATLSLFLIGYLLLFPIISIVQMPMDEFFVAFVRYFAVALLLITAILNSKIIQGYTEPIIIAFTYIVAASALLIIYQALFGSIDFFNFTEVTERLGYRRYGSLLGSTTTFGTISPIAILLVYAYRDSYNTIVCRLIEFLIIVSGIFCLSKAFFVNIALAYALIFLKRIGNKKKLKSKTVIKLMIGLLMFTVALWYLIQNTVVGDYFHNMVNYSFNNDYQGVESDLLQRLTVLPTEAFKYHGIGFGSLFFGVGFKGYSGVLGLPIYPMCHNNYADIVLSQGIPFLIILFVLYIKLFLFYFNRDSEISGFVKQLIPYILLNMLAGQYSYIHIYPMIFLTLILADYINYRLAPK